jgi:hypothetical protein
MAWVRGMARPPKKKKLLLVLLCRWYYHRAKEGWKGREVVG